MLFFSLSRHPYLYRTTGVAPVFRCPAPATTALQGLLSIMQSPAAGAASVPYTRIITSENIEKSPFSSFPNRFNGLTPLTDRQYCRATKLFLYPNDSPRHATVNPTPIRRFLYPADKLTDCPLLIPAFFSHNSNYKTVYVFCPCHLPLK